VTVPGTVRRGTRKVMLDVHALCAWGTSLNHLAVDDGAGARCGTHRVWPWVGLRGAGFPAEVVLRLAAPQTARSIDAMLALEASREAACVAAIDQVSARLAALRGDSPDLMKPWRKAAKALRAGRPVSAEGPLETLTDVLRSHADLCAAVDRAGQEIRATFTAEIAATRKALLDACGDARFREALAWQNREVLDVLARLAAHPLEHADKRTRVNERTVALYLSRYCVKNDTIGFFGPLGWAKVDPTVETMELQPGAGLIARRETYLEAWAVNALAEKLTSAANLRRFAPVRLSPHVALDGDTIVRAFGDPTPLDAVSLHVARASTGVRADQIARAVANAMGAREDTIFTVLERLKADGIVEWGFTVRNETFAERTLQRLLEEIPQQDLRADALAQLERLVDAKRDVAASAGDAERVRAAMDRAAMVFTEVTERDAKRSPGQMYAGRTIAYEECIRDVDVRLGKGFLDAVSAPLGLLLQSARWLSHDVAQRFHESIEAAAARLGPLPIPLLPLWMELQPELVALGNLAVADLQRRWQEVLQIEEGERIVYRSSFQLAPAVERHFGGSRPGWQLARYVSPDLMVAASSPAAFARGEGNVVVGELHVGMPLLWGAWVVNQHPAPDELRAAWAGDRVVPHVLPLPAPSMPQGNSPGLLADDDVRLEAFVGGVGNPPAVPIGALVLDRAGQAIVVRTRDGLQHWAPVEVFGLALSYVIHQRFDLLPRRPSAPRIVIDRCVVRRAQWAFAAGELAFAHEPELAARMVAARRFAAQHKLPRFVFVKVAAETKPVYVDLESPVLIDIFAKIVRTANDADGPDAKVSISEMLPNLDDTWLTDASGTRYTSELRAVMVDPLIPDHFARSGAANT
jgi:hypothetical protein